MQRSLISLAAIPALSLAMMVAPAMADQVAFRADLTAAQETPPTDSTGTGTLDATYDTSTKTLTWTVTYDGLSGEVTAAHFHGPAAMGAKADPVVPIQPPFASPIKGKATLTDAQATDLQTGMWYFNLHTAKYSEGEVRGQLVQDNTSSRASSMSPLASKSSSSADSYAPSSSAAM